MYHAIFLTEHDRHFRIPPLGPYLLAHILRSLGYKILVVDMYSVLRNNLKEILKNAIGNETLFVGYSSTLFSTNFDFSTYSYPWIPTEVDFFIDINNYIKELNPKCKIIFGGSHSKTFVMEAASKNNNFNVDFAMHGYSEGMIVDFIRALEVSKIPKFSKKTAGIYEIEYDSTGATVDFKNSTMKWYDEDYIQQNESLPMEVARGCIFKCKFCSYPLLGKDPKDSSYIKNENQIYNEIIENYEKFKTTTYFVVDDTFNENDEKIKMMLRVRDRTKLDLNFVGYLRLDLIHRRKQQLDLLYDLKFNGMFLGIESLHYPVLKYIGKGIKPEHIKETLHNLRDKFKNKISLVGGFIVGLPHETEETFRSWAEYVISDECPLSWANFNPLLLTQNGRTTHNESEFFKNYGQYGYEIYDKYLWKNSHWDFKKCGSLALEYNRRALSSDKQKIPALYALGLKKYNYDYYELINTPEKFMYEENYDFYNKNNGIKHQINSTFKNHYENYKNLYLNHILRQSKL